MKKAGIRILAAIFAALLLYVNCRADRSGYDDAYDNDGASGEASPEILDLFVVSPEPGGGEFSTDNKNVRSDDVVRILCVVRGKDKVSGAEYYYCNKEVIAGRGLRIGGRPIEPALIRSWDEGRYGRLKVILFKVQPRLTHKDGRCNDRSVDFDGYANAGLPWGPNNRKWLGYDEIEYFEELFQTGGINDTFSVDAKSGEARFSSNPMVGTMRFRAKVERYEGGRVIFSIGTKGKESLEKHGISNDVHRISFREDDSAVGWAKSYINVPGVFGSTKVQARDFIGIDCADLIVAAYSLHLREEFDFTNVNGLFNYATPVIKNVYFSKEGLFYKSFDYSKKSGKKVEQSYRYGVDVMPGDIIVFDYPRPNGSYDHVGLICRDLSADGETPDGILNGYDTIFHAGPAEAHESRLDEDCFVGDEPVKISVLKWRRK